MGMESTKGQRLVLMICIGIEESNECLVMQRRCTGLQVDVEKEGKMDFSFDGGRF